LPVRMTVGFAQFLGGLLWIVTNFVQHPWLCRSILSNMIGSRHFRFITCAKWCEERTNDSVVAWRTLVREYTNGVNRGIKNAPDFQWSGNHARKLGRISLSSSF
jgi:hypothetical protein